MSAENRRRRWANLGRQQHYHEQMSRDSMYGVAPAPTRQEKIRRRRAKILADVRRRLTS